ncbi:hypothetical protein ES765_16140 [Maribacter sp. ACAM166]|nr:hypothetical protein ES765_16140 [Maribacter sp. ACAM166]
MENTLVFFLPDNGGSAEEFGFRDSIVTYYEDVERDEIKVMPKDELQTRMVPKYTRNGKPVLAGKGLQPGAANTYLGYGKQWANARNTPFRMYKHWVQEGGIATPLIVHCPDGISRKDTFVKDPTHLINIMATCLEVANAKYPKTYNENSIIPFGRNQSYTNI